MDLRVIIHHFVDRGVLHGAEHAGNIRGVFQRSAQARPHVPFVENAFRFGKAVRVERFPRVLRIRDVFLNRHIAVPGEKIQRTFMLGRRDVF